MQKKKSRGEKTGESTTEMRLALSLCHLIRERAITRTSEYFVLIKHPF